MADVTALAAQNRQTNGFPMGGSAGISQTDDALLWQDLPAGPYISKLTTLNLKLNFFIEIPKSLTGAAPRLRRLDMSHNLLRPSKMDIDTVLQLPSLQNLWITKVGLSGPASSVQGGTKPAHVSLTPSVARTYRTVLVQARGVSSLDELNARERRPGRLSWQPSQPFLLQILGGSLPILVPGMAIQKVVLPG